MKLTLFCKVCFFPVLIFQTVHYPFFYIIPYSALRVFIWYTLMPQNAQTKVPTYFRPPLYTSWSKGISICTSGSHLGSALLKATVLPLSALTGHSHLVWLLFEGSIPTCACFHSENFLSLVTVRTRCRMREIIAVINSSSNLAEEIQFCFC